MTVDWYGNPRIRGINYDPRGTDPTSISTLHIEFQVHATLRGLDVTLRGEGSGRGRPITPTDDPSANGATILKCAAGTTGCLTFFPELHRDSGALQYIREILIVRFAQYGNSELAKGKSVTWLVEMEDGQALRGKLSQPATSDGPGFPGTFAMGGAMVLTIRDPGGNLYSLRSRKNPMFEGKVSQWPPVGTTMKLVNGPIEYYAVDELGDRNADPVLNVSMTTINFLENCSLFATRVRPTHIEVIGDDGFDHSKGPVRGVKIHWQPVEVVHEDLLIGPDHYHIYRRFDDQPVDSWEKIGSVPWQHNLFFDTGFDGTIHTQYIVLHAMDLALGYKYEGLFGQPIVVRAVAAK